MPLPCPVLHEYPQEDFATNLADLNQLKGYAHSRAYIPLADARARIRGAQTVGLPRLLSYIYHPDPRVPMALITATHICPVQEYYGCGLPLPNTLQQAVALDIQRHANSWTPLLDHYLESAGGKRWFSDRSNVYQPSGTSRQYYDEQGSLVKGAISLDAAIVSLSSWLSSDPEPEEILASLKHASAPRLHYTATQVRRLTPPLIDALLKSDLGYVELINNPHITTADRTYISEHLATRLGNILGDAPGAVYAAQGDRNSDVLFHNSEFWAGPVLLPPQTIYSLLKGLGKHTGYALRSHFDVAFTHVAGQLPPHQIQEILTQSVLSSYELARFIRLPFVTPDMHVALVNAYRTGAARKALIETPGLAQSPEVRRLLSQSTSPAVCQAILPYEKGSRRVQSLWKKSMKPTKGTAPARTIYNLVVAPEAPAILYIPIEFLSEPIPQGYSYSGFHSNSTTDGLLHMEAYQQLLVSLMAARMVQIGHAQTPACQTVADQTVDRLRKVYSDLLPTPSSGQCPPSTAPTDEQIHTDCVKLTLYLFENHPDLKVYFNLHDTKNLLTCADPELRSRLISLLSSLPRTAGTAPFVVPSAATVATLRR